MSKRHCILVVDDDSVFRQQLQLILKNQGLRVLEAADAAEGLDRLSQTLVDCMLLDITLPDQSGLELMAIIKRDYPNLPVIMISASGQTQDVVKAIQVGAKDYLNKPLDQGILEEKIKLYLNLNKPASSPKEEGQELASPLKQILGNSAPCRLLVQELGKIANSDATVLLRGESGTGKSMVAEVIHRHSQRREGPFVTLNCTAIPETLLESELFGHVKGAFTGAHRDHLGRFQAADGGTIFLDEIGEISKEIQVKLLRLLQAKEFEPVGSLKTVKVDVRIITATNRHLEQAIEEGSFREDLFYRLNVLPVFVPALREREDDVLFLAEHFIKLYGAKVGKSFTPLSQELKNFLKSYTWPGNIRELQNVVERAVILAQSDSLQLGDFKLKTKPKPLTSQRAFQDSFAEIRSLKDMEYQELTQALQSHRGNISAAARHLGIARDTVYRRLKKYQIALKT